MTFNLWKKLINKKIVSVLFILPLLMLFFFGITSVGTVLSQELQNSCAEASVTPVGALPGQPKPLWCYFNLTPNSAIPNTHIAGTNSWLDEFDHGVSFGEFKDGMAGYRIFEGKDIPGNDDNCITVHWRHANHWMTDVRFGPPQNPEWPTGRGCFASFMRPDKSFTFEDFNDGKGKRLVVEFDSAAGIAAYHGDGVDSWPDVVITGADKPTGVIRDFSYGYGHFGGFDTVGCRMQSERGPICSFLRGSGGPLDTSRCSIDIGPGREWEVSAHQQCGSTHWGGGPFESHMDPATGVTLDKAWRKCEGVDPDMNCRDRFRWELYRDGMVMYVNGVKYFEERGMTGAKQLSDSLFNAQVYVYFIDKSSQFTSTPAVRFHWDRLAINPKDSQGKLLGLSSAPGWCPDQPNGVCTGSTTPAPTVTATPTPVPSASSTPVSTPTPTVTPIPSTEVITFDDKAGVNVGLNGQYPTGVIGWGNGMWFLSAPWEKFTTKSISFNGSTRKSGSFSFVLAKLLTKLDIYNGGSTTSKVTLKCLGNTNKVVNVASKQLLAGVTTGWIKPCKTVTITTTNGWDTNFDNLVIK